MALHSVLLFAGQTQQAMETANKITLRVSGRWFSECHQSFHRERSAGVPSSVAVILGTGLESESLDYLPDFVYRKPEPLVCGSSDPLGLSHSSSCSRPPAVATTLRVSPNCSRPRLQP